MATGGISGGGSTRRWRQRRTIQTGDIQANAGGSYAGAAAAANLEENGLGMCLLPVVAWGKAWWQPAAATCGEVRRWHASGTPSCLQAEAEGRSRLGILKQWLSMPGIW